MLLGNLSVGADEVVRSIVHDIPGMFLGAAFVTSGLVAAGFSVIRGKRDPLLIYFGLFAVLYGLRLWTESNLVGAALPDSVWLAHSRSAINYIVPIPFILYLHSAGLLTGIGRVAGYLLATVDGALAIITLAIGPRHEYDVINDLLVILALLVLVVQFLPRKHEDKDLIVVRRGLLVFAGFALWDNLADLYFRIWKVEALGFAFFLACLGYVAARRTLQRDQQLSEIKRELEVARRIQLSILPSEFPPSAHFNVAALYRPMTSVAGDLYEYVVAGNGVAGLLIADVSGHGVPAALIASMVKMAAASQREAAADPAEFLLGMNRVLCGNTQNQFVTAAYAYVDSTAGILKYSAAGHPPMLLLHDGEVHEIAENGLILGVFDSAIYSTVSRSTKKGDRLLLYTDGLIEASNDAGEFYGREALIEMLKRTAIYPAAEAAERIISSVQRWSAAQQDDLTLLVCDLTGA
jgi:phosphoserine phosphatase RsbU/P